MKKTKSKVKIQRAEHVKNKGKDTYYSLPAFITTNESSVQDIMDLWSCTEPPLTDK